MSSRCPRFGGTVPDREGLRRRQATTNAARRRRRRGSGTRLRPRRERRRPCRQFRSVPDLVGKRLCGQPEGLDVRQIGATDARPPEHQVADDGGELLPLPDWDLWRGRRERAFHGRKKAAHVDVKLVLGSNDGGIDDESDFVPIRPTPAGAFEKGPRAPCGSELVRRIWRLQKRVFDANDLSRRGENHIMQQRRAQHDVAAIVAPERSTSKARKGSAGQLVIDDTGPTPCHSADRSRPTAKVANAVMPLRRHEGALTRRR